MSRLTKYNRQGKAIYDSRAYVLNENPFDAIFEKLAHYEDLEEQGRLIELPCAVGDIVWSYDIVDGKPYIYEYRTPNEPMCILVKDLWGIRFFATKEEAEVKLKELNNNR